MLRPRWEQRFARLTAAVDISSVLVVVGLGHVLGLGDRSPLVEGSISPALGLLVAVLTISCLLITRAWDPRVLGHGSEEISRLLRGFVTAAVVLGLAGLAGLPAVRPWVFGLLPLAGALSLVGRFGLRKWLHHRRATGRFVHPTLVVASVESAAELIQRTRRDRFAGWTVTGVCTPTGSGLDGAKDVLGVPVLGDLDSVTEVAISGCYRVVSFGQTPGWSANRLHQLAWDLEGTGTELAVDPGLMEAAGPRLHITPVDGFPLLRLTHPVFDGLSRVVKSAVDRVGATLLLLLVLPGMLALAIAIKSDGGPAFFRQTRIGRHGQPFMMIKFRSMVVDAEARKAELHHSNDGAGPLFKMRNDPRVTRVGARGTSKSVKLA